ncbi:ester cyclase [Arthrobacter sp. NPDC080073]|uniref:ester cyclase n=1 Tax=Arthrobacter sp. NPDC080073 TaxID=3155919 RepID=UPI00342C80B4
MTDGTGLIGRFYKEIIEGGNLDLIDELATDNMVDHEEALPGQPSGKEGVRFFVTAIRAAFPDIKVKTMEPWLTDGNLEACHVVMTGTHRGDMAGIPASGNSVEFGGTDIIRVEDGKVAEHWGSTDTLSLMQQIGAIPQ